MLRNSRYFCSNLIDLPRNVYLVISLLLDWLSLVAPLARSMRCFLCSDTTGIQASSFCSTVTALQPIKWDDPNFVTENGDVNYKRHAAKGFSCLCCDWTPLSLVENSNRGGSKRATQRGPCIFQGRSSCRKGFACIRLADMQALLPTSFRHQEWYSDDVQC